MIRKTKLFLKMVIFLFLLSSIVHLLSLPCHAKTVSSRELIENAKSYDGREVTYTGEAVGDVMIRGDHAWINVSDGENALGVFCSKELAKDIKYVGRYNTKGDIIIAEGVFNKACAMHGGDLDIHALRLKKAKDGKIFAENMDEKKGIAAFVFILTAVIIFIGYLLFIDKLRKRRLSAGAESGRFS